MFFKFKSELIQEIEDLKNALGREVDFSRELMDKKQDLEKENRDLREDYRKARQYLEEIIEGRPLGKYDRPAILKLAQELELEKQDYKKLNEELQKQVDKNKQTLEITKRDLEIHYLNEFSRKRDDLMTLMVTKAPVQNLLVDKDSTRY